MVYILGLDDTDIAGSRGTGQLARSIASRLSGGADLLGVLRHQLLFDPRIAYTKNNSSAAILFNTDEPTEVLAGKIRMWMLAEFVDGSDPGFCLASQVSPSVIQFGWRAKREVLTQAEAFQIVGTYGMHLAALGGDGSGIIGALAATGLAASGDDGRYIEYGTTRSLNGLQPIENILAAGVTQVLTLQDEPVESGLVLVDKLRPSRRCGQPVAYVENKGDFWQALKID